MDYHITASSVSYEDAVIFIKRSSIDFGTIYKTVKNSCTILASIIRTHDV